MKERLSDIGQLVTTVSPKKRETDKVSPKIESTYRLKGDDVILVRVH